MPRRYRQRVLELLLSMIGELPASVCGQFPAATNRMLLIAEASRRAQWPVRSLSIRDHRREVGKT